MIDLNLTDAAETPSTQRIPVSQLSQYSPRFDAYLDPAYEPMRSRVREIERKAGALDDSLIRMATMVRATHLGSLRTFSGGLAHPNGWYPAVKAQKVLHWEGTAQLNFIMRCESDFGVERIGSENVRLLFNDGGKRRQYTADVEIVRPDGSILVVEIKRDERDIENEDLRRTYAIVAEIFRRCQIDFVIVFADEIISNRHHRANVELFASRARRHIGRHHLHRLEAHASSTNCVSTYGALAAALEPQSEVHGKSIVQALTAARRVQIDLHDRLRDDTELTIN